MADLTYVRTWAGFLALAVVVEAFSRRVEVWQVPIICAPSWCWKRSTWRCGNAVPPASSITGIKAASIRCTPSAERCREMRVEPFMGYVGDCFDNAMGDSFFATLDCKLIDRGVFPARAEDRMAFFLCTGGWYNPHRRHSGLGDLPTLNFERGSQQDAQMPSYQLSTETGQHHRDHRRFVAVGSVMSLALKTAWRLMRKAGFHHLVRVNNRVESCFTEPKAT